MSDTQAEADRVILASDNRGERSAYAAYLFDTIKFGEMLELNGGLRYEHASGFNRTQAYSVTPGATLGDPTTQTGPFRNSDDLFSYRVGLVFKPTPDISLYVAHGNSKNPSQASVDASCAANNCNLRPETTKNYEIGVKADLFNKGLLVEAALFRNERSNFRTPSNDPAQPVSLQVLDGRSRVDGLALGVSGNLTRAWSIFANYTYLDGTVVQSVSDFCLTNPSATCGNSTALRDPQAGRELVQTPKHAGSLFTTYRLPFGLEVGYGLTYQGSFALNAPNIFNTTQYRSDDYLIHRAFLAYTFGGGLTAQLNVQNLTNERYYTGIRNNVSATTGAVTGGWAIPAERRSAVLSLFYSF